MAKPLGTTLMIAIVAGACRTTVYIADPGQLPPAVRQQVSADTSRAAALVAATPEALDRLAKSRRATAEVMAALAQRTTSVLIARYGVRPQTPQAALLLELVDSRSGPAFLELRTEADPTQRSAGVMTVLGVVVRARYRTLAGRHIAHRIVLDLFCRDRGEVLEVLELVPTMTEVLRE